MVVPNVAEEYAEMVGVREPATRAIAERSVLFGHGDGRFHAHANLIHHRTVQRLGETLLDPTCA